MVCPIFVSRRSPISIYPPPQLQAILRSHSPGQRKKKLILQLFCSLRHPDHAEKASLDYIDHHLTKLPVPHYTRYKFLDLAVAAPNHSRPYAAYHHRRGDLFGLLDHLEKGVATLSRLTP